MTSEKHSAPVSDAMKIPAMLALFSALLFLLPPIFDMPFGRDQGIFAWVAQSVLQGGLPYVDAFDNKGPATFYLYAMALQFDAGHAYGLRALDILLILAALMAVIDLVRHWQGPQAGWLAGLLTLALLHLDFWNLGQPDLWASEIGLLMLWLALKNPTPVRMAGAGVLAGLMVTLKIPYVLIGLAFILVLIQERQYRHLLAFMTGALVCPLACLALYASEGQLQTLWDVTFTYNFYVHADLPDKHFWRDLLTLRIYWPANTSALALIQLANDMLLLALAGSGLCILWRSGRRYHVKVLVLLWLAAYAIVSIQAKYFFYHYTLLALVTALPAAVLLGRAQGWWRQTAATTLMLMLAFPALCLIGKPLEWWQGGPTRTQWQASSSWGDFNYGLTAEAADYVKENTQSIDTVYVWGVDSLVNALSERASPTRFGYNLPLVLAKPPLRQTFTDEVMEALAARPPSLIVVQRNDQNDLAAASVVTLTEFPALVNLIERDYRLRWENAAFAIYGRHAAVQNP